MATRAAGHKYGAVRTEYGGYTFDSMAEADYALLLDVRKARGEIAVWLRPAHAIVLLAAPKAADRVTYRPDFLVGFPDGRSEWVEVKGVETPAWRIKLKLWKAFGPTDPLRIVYGDGREAVVTSRKGAALSPAAGGGDGAE